MANAYVYARFKGAGNGWNGPFGQGTSTMADRVRGEDNSGTHAERVAWRQAISADNRANLNAWYAGSSANFPDANVQIKIAIDQLVCPSCQAWIASYVLDDASRLTAAATRQVEVFIEVTTAGRSLLMGLGNNTSWSLRIAQQRTPTLELAGAHG